MKIGKMEFPQRVFTASGAQGFTGEGWWYHRFLKPFGLKFDKATLITKTVTTQPRLGNLKNSILPDCIKVNFAKEAALNAVGLTNAGVQNYLVTWATIRKPFVISFATVGESLEDKVGESWGFATSLLKVLHRMNPEMAIQYNVSCPNVGQSYTIDGLKQILQPLRYLKLPIIIKVNSLFPIEKILELENFIDAVSLGNSLPWDSLSDELKVELFGSITSPLKKYGGGGLSGRPLLPYTLRALGELRWMGFRKPIIAGGGIMDENAIHQVFEVGADAVELGSVCFLRPWRVESMIQTANNCF